MIHLKANNKITPALHILSNCLRKEEDDGIIIYDYPPWGNERRVWNMQIGNPPEPKAMKYLKSYVKAFKARNYYNTDTGEVVKIT